MRALAALAAALAAAMVWIGGAAEAEADAYTVEPFNRVMEVAEGADVRAGPGPDYAVRVTLNEGVKVRVTGAVRDSDWLRVDLRGDGGAAFVYAPLLKETATVEPLGADWSIARNQPCQVWNQGRGDEYGPFTWSGACVDGKASGEGRLVWSSRFGRYVYEGGMEAGKLHGKGKLVQSDGGSLQGPVARRQEARARDLQVDHRPSLPGRLARRQAARIRDRHLRRRRRSQGPVAARLLREEGGPMGRPDRQCGRLWL